MTALASNYRIFELPWTPSEEEERRFRRLLTTALIVFALFGLIVPLLPVEQRPIAPPVAEEAVKLVLQPPPPPPKPVEKPKEEPKPIVEEKPKPVPVDREELARKKAQKQVNAWKDQLADLRDALLPKDMVNRDLLNKVEGPSRSDRSLITSKVTSGSGGINTAALSSGFGGATGTLNGHQTTQGISSFADSITKNRGEATRSGASGKAARSREEIEMVFDRNKSAIYALYNRALRDNPALQGKVVVELTIAPSGEVTACRIVSSELNDADLEHKLVARIKLFRFDTKDVEAITTTKPIDFFPA